MWLDHMKLGYLKLKMLKVESVALFVAACKHKEGSSSQLTTTRSIVACTYTACTYIANYLGMGYYICFNRAIR